MYLVHLYLVQVGGTEMCFCGKNEKQIKSVNVCFPERYQVIVIMHENLLIWVKQAACLARLEICKNTLQSQFKESSLFESLSQCL